MMHKAWRRVEEVPYCLSRSFVNFHAGQKKSQFLPELSFRTLTTVGIYQWLWNVTQSLMGIWTTRTQDNSYPGQLVPRTTRTKDNSYPGRLVPRTIRTQDDSYPGQLVPKTTITKDDSYPGQLVPRTTRTKDDSYPGQLVLRTTRTQDDSFPAQVVPRTTLPKLYPGQLVSRTSRNHSQIITILSKTFPLLGS